MSSLFADAVLVHAYTRAQAIEDGCLVDVSETAREAGFKVPVALTAAVWAELREAEGGPGGGAAGVRPSVGREPVKGLCPPTGQTPPLPTSPRWGEGRTPPPPVGEGWGEGLRIPARGDPGSAPRTGDCVAWDNEQEVCYQDESGRLWDVLAMAFFEARAHRDAQRLPFSVLRVRCGGLRPELVRLVLHIGPGDEGEPVITIMQPGED